MRAHLQAHALDVVVVVQDGVLARGGAVRGDRPPVEHAVAVPEHLQSIHPSGKAFTP